jgi:hypothetical protein
MQLMFCQELGSPLGQPKSVNNKSEYKEVEDDILTQLYGFSPGPYEGGDGQQADWKLPTSS